MVHQLLIFQRNHERIDWSKLQILTKHYGCSANSIGHLYNGWDGYVFTQKFLADVRANVRHAYSIVFPRAKVQSNLRRVSLANVSYILDA